MKIYVNDNPMGYGKSSSMINWINTHKEFNYVYVTPFLNEVKRIKEGCEDFEEPTPKWEESTKRKNKTKGFNELITNSKNVVTTHSLLQEILLDENTLELFKMQDRVLILDEVMQCVEDISMPKDLIPTMISEGSIRTDEKGKLHFVKNIDLGKDGDRLIELIQSGNVYRYGESNEILIWTLPIELFKYCKKVIVLTYGYHYQEMRMFMELNGIEALYVDNSYDFDSATNTPPSIKGSKYKDLVTIYDGKLNDIGIKKTSLSNSWFVNSDKEKGKPNFKELTKNINSIKRKFFNCTENSKVEIINITENYEVEKKIVNNCMFTVFKQFQNKITPHGLSNNFLIHNKRATNNYKKIGNMAYCVNRFYNPILRNWFEDLGIVITEEDQNNFALIEMLQWLFRSRVRDLQHINVYVPSSRQRELLIGWLNN